MAENLLLKGVHFTIKVAVAADVHKEALVVDWKAIEQKPNQATRAASATVLGVLATQVENMIVSSADLSNSDKTDGFLKKTHAFVKGDFSGAFLQAGVAELTMRSEERRVGKECRSRWSPYH